MPQTTDAGLRLIDFDAAQRASREQVHPMYTAVQVDIRASQWTIKAGSMTGFSSAFLSHYSVRFLSSAKLPSGICQARLLMRQPGHKIRLCFHQRALVDSFKLAIIASNFDQPVKSIGS